MTNDILFSSEAHPWWRQHPWLARALLSIISTILFSADDFIQQCFISANQATIETKFVIAVWVMSFALWLINSRWLSTLILSVLALMQFCQLASISYFGQPITVADINNAIVDYKEVWQSGAANVLDHINVAVAVGIPYTLLIYLHRRIQIPTHPATALCGLLIVTAILGSKPYRATYRGVSFFTPGPTRAALHNSLNTFSFYAVRHAELNRSPQITQPEWHFTVGPAKSQHLWIVIADSLYSGRLPHFGYPRDTMPRLQTRINEGEALAKPGIAAGVSTLVSLSNMFNLIHEPAQQHLLKSRPYNLFKWAKSQGYKTFWLSSQESKLMGFLDTASIDVKITHESELLEFAEDGDAYLLEVLKQQAWAEKNLVVINLRTVHSPYRDNYTGFQEGKPLWADGDEQPRSVRESNAYDNALYYLDDLLGSFINEFSALHGNRQLIFTGDHGQLLGQNQLWGHNKLLPEVIEVPVIAVHQGPDDDALKQLRNDRWVSHAELMLWTMDRMGIDISIPNYDPTLHYVRGSLLLGDNTFITVKETDAGLEFGPKMLTSKWVLAQQTQHRSP